MYAYLAKGATVGHVLTRRVLRGITSIPGVLLDLMLAILWVPEYTSYWDTNSAYIDYADGTRLHGVMQGAFGWIGELLGFVIGAPVGAIIGATLFFPDLLHQGLLSLKHKIYDSVDAFAVFIGQTTFFENVYEAPSSYSQKAWNLGVAVSTIFTAIPYLAAKALEFFLPFLPLSMPIAYIGSELGGLAGWAIGALLYIPIHFLDKCTDLIELCRNAVLNGVALIYGKSGEVPAGANGYRSECCVPDNAVHSDKFRDQVEHYKNTTWAKLIFGPLKGQASSVKEGKNSVSPNELLDPITFEPLGVNGTPTVIDPHGHTFNDGKGNGDIRFWIRKNHSCPIDRQYLNEADLIPNRAFDDLVAQMNFNK